MSRLGYIIGAAIYRIEQALWHHFGLLVGDYRKQWESKVRFYRDML